MRRRQTVLDSPVTNRGLLLAVSYLGEVIRGRQRYSPDCVADTLGKLEEELLHDMNSEDNATAEYLHGPGLQRARLASQGSHGDATTQ